MPTTLDFRILGSLEVLHEGRQIALGGDKQRALLALLLLHANETLSTERLIDELWAERPPANAVKTVQMQISRLRKALAAGADGDHGDGVVVTRGHGYALELPRRRLDSHRFEQLAAEGSAALAAARPEEAVSTLERALSLWRGEPLVELVHEPFARRAVARLDDLRVGALEQLIEAKLALGGHAGVVGQLEALIAEHPYRERLRAQLMLALYRGDRQADALQAYQDARRILVGELGIEPGEHLRELERAVLAQDPALHLVAGKPAAAPGVDRSRDPFVGRERELTALVEGLDAAFDGRGGLFLLAGEPGIGKSRLAEELIVRARGRGARILVGRCWEAGGAPAYWPWVQALRPYLHETETLPELRDLLGDLPPVLPLDSEGDRFRLFVATVALLRDASVDSPLVLFLDDLHAADTPSLLLLRFLARELRSTRMLVLGAYRDVDPMPANALAEMLAEVTREAVTRRLALRGLSKREVVEYVESTARDVDASQLAAGLYEETEGNPLFVGEIVRLRSIEHAASEEAGDGPRAIPQSISDVIARRLAHLSEECRRILVLASVIGREFALDTLVRMGDITEDELLGVLDEAQTARVVSDAPSGTSRLRFAHVLIRDTLYEGVTSTRRVRLHRLVVDALEALHGDDPGPHVTELAYHSVAGKDPGRGVRYARHAGDRALALLAYEEAARLYTMALEALEDLHPMDEQARCELLLGVGDAAVRAGDIVASKRAFLDAAQIARRLGLRRELARAAAGYGGRFMWARAAGDAHLVPLLQEGLAALAEEDVDLRAGLLARLAGVLRDEHSREGRDRLSREAVDLARRTANPAALAYALDGRLAAIAAPDTVDECRALARELREVAERIGDAERVVNALDHTRTGQLMAGELREAEAALDRERRFFDELRQPAQLWQVGSARAMFALAAGRLADAEELIPYAFAFGQRALPDVAIPVFRLQSHALRDFQGRLDVIAPAIRELVDEYPTRPAFRCTLAQVDARLGRMAEAQRALDELARDDCAGLPFDQEWLYGMSLLAETACLIGDSESGAVLYRLLVPWSTFSAADHPEGFRGSVARYVGLLATLTRRWDEGERHFEDAAAANERMGARPWLAHTHSDHARLLLARDEPGDSARALRLAGCACDGYRSLGMDAFAAEATLLERRLAATGC